MIRTRDFLLYVLTLLFLVIGISSTGLSLRSSPEGEPVSARLTSQDSKTQAIYGDETTNQSNVLARMREKIAAGSGHVISAPPVLTSVDTPEEEEEETVVSAETLDNMSAQYCDLPLPNHSVATWPRNTQLFEVDNTRTVSHEIVRQVVVGSSTENVIETDTYTALPIRTVRSNFDSCLPDMTIGVTPDGQPLNNFSVSGFRGYSHTMIVGYTRDGFAIYGPMPDESVLDTCGGYYVNGSYRYHVRSAADGLIGCFGGIPVNF